MTTTLPPAALGTCGGQEAGPRSEHRTAPGPRQPSPPSPPSEDQGGDELMCARSDAFADLDLELSPELDAPLIVGLLQRGRGAETVLAFQLSDACEVTIGEPSALLDIGSTAAALRRAGLTVAHPEPGHYLELIAAVLPYIETVDDLAEYTAEAA